MVCFMYDWPVFLQSSKGQSNFVALHSLNPSGIFCTVFDDEVLVYDQRTLTVVFHYKRSEDSVIKYGANIKCILKDDSNHLALLTAGGYLLLLHLTSCTVPSINSSIGSERELQIIEHQWSIEDCGSVMVGDDVANICVYGEHLFTAFKNGTVAILAWDGETLGKNVTLNQTPFYHDMEHSRARKLSSPGLYCQVIEWAPTFGGLITILSSGDIAVLRTLEDSDDSWKLEGIWAERSERPISLSVNNRFRTIAVGSENSEISLYRLDETAGTVFRQQRLRISNREYPDASSIVGPATELAWSTDGYTLAVAWAHCGWAMWSVFGGLLHTSLGERVGLAERVRLSSIVWSANDCRLLAFLTFLIPMKTPSAAGASNALMNGHCERESAVSDQLVVFQIARSVSTTNPTSDNHQHLLLQASDRILLSSRNQLTTTRTPETLLVPELYLKHNWPLQFVAANQTADRVAVSGSHGFALYNFGTRRWSMFGNEVQERSFKVCGGIVWWKEFVCFGCYCMSQSVYELRTYPSTERLDYQFASKCRFLGSGEPILLDTFENLIGVLTTEGRVQVFRLSQLDARNKKFLVGILMVQVIDLNNLIQHPTCVVRLCLSSITANLPISGDSGQKRRSKTEENTSAVNSDISDQLSFPPSSDPSGPIRRPCSLLLNYAGYLFILQPSISSEAGSGTPGVGVESGKKPLLLTPFLIASNVELVWPASAADLNTDISVLPLSTTDQQRLRPYLTDSLWLYCGALGLQVWLPLPQLHSASPPLSPSDRTHHMTQSANHRSKPVSPSALENHTHPMIHGRTHLSPGYISRRIMLSIELEEDVHPLAILFQQAVSVGVLNEFRNHPSGFQGLDQNDAADDFYTTLPYGVIHLETHAFLHRLIQELLRKNLGAHALQLCFAYRELPHFHRLLEWLLHEVLETEATSKSPIPDPLLPQVVAFIQEFPNFLETVASCARKTELARWPHLFAAVGRTPKDLFDLCIEYDKLEAAASYLIILQASEPATLSHDSTLHLIEVAVDASQWSVVRELMRFLNAIDPLEFKHPMSASGPTHASVDLHRDSMRLPEVRNDSHSTAPAKSARRPIAARPDLKTVSKVLRETVLPSNVEVEPVHSPRKPLSLSECDDSDTNTPNLTEQIQEWLAQKLTSLFSEGRLRQMAELVINFPSLHSPSDIADTNDPLGRYISIQKAELHCVLDWPASLVQLHNQFDFPLPSTYHEDLESIRHIASAPASCNRTFSLRPTSPELTGMTDTTLRQLRYLLMQLLQAGSFEWAVLVALTIQDRVGLLEAVTLAVDASTRSTLSRLKEWHATTHSSERRTSRLWQRVVGSQNQPSSVQIAHADHETGASPSQLFGDPLSRVHAGLKQIDSWAVEHCLPYHQFLETLQPALDQVVEQASSFFGQCASGNIAGTAQLSCGQRRPAYSDSVSNTVPGLSNEDVSTGTTNPQVFATNTELVQLRPAIPDGDGDVSELSQSEHPSLDFISTIANSDQTLRNISPMPSVPDLFVQTQAVTSSTASLVEDNSLHHSKVQQKYSMTGEPLNTKISETIVLLPFCEDHDIHSNADEYVVNATEEISLRDYSSASNSRTTCVLS